MEVIEEENFSEMKLTVINLEPDSITRLTGSIYNNVLHVLKEITESDFGDAEARYMGGNDSVISSFEGMEYVMKMMKVRNTKSKIAHIVQSLRGVLDMVSYLTVLDEQSEWLNHKKGECLSIDPEFYTRENPQLRGNKTEPNNELTDIITGFPFVTHVVIPKDGTDSAEDVLFLCADKEVAVSPLRFSCYQKEFFKICEKVCSLKYFKVVESLKEKRRKLEAHDVHVLFYNIIAKMACHMIMSTVVNTQEYSFMKEVSSVAESHLMALRDKFKGVDEMINVITSDSRIIVIPKMTLAMSGEFFIMMFKGQYTENKERIIKIEEDYYNFILYLCMVLKNIINPMEKMDLEQVFQKFGVNAIVTCLELSRKYISNELAYECLLMLLSMFRITIKEKFLMSENQLGSTSSFTVTAEERQVSWADIIRQRVTNDYNNNNNSNKRSHHHVNKEESNKRTKLSFVPEDVLPPSWGLQSLRNRGEEEKMENFKTVEQNKQVEEMERSEQEKIGFLKAQEVENLSDELMRLNKIHSIPLTDFLYCTQSLVVYLFEELPFNELTKGKIESMREWFIIFMLHSFTVDFTIEEMFPHLDSLLLMYYLAHDSLVYHLLKRWNSFEFTGEKITQDQQIAGKAEKMYVRANCLKMLLDVYCVMRISGLHNEMFGNRWSDKYKTDYYNLVEVRQKLHTFASQMEQKYGDTLALSEKFNVLFAESTERVLIRHMLYWDSPDALKEIV